MSDIPRLVDDAIVFAKCEGLDAAWVEWCELAYETGGQQRGLSKEESGRALLAGHWEVSFDARGEFKHTLDKRIIEAVDAKKWVLKAPSGEPISPDRITSWSFEFGSSLQYGTGCIVLIDGNRVPRARLVRAKAEAVTTPGQQQNSAPSPGILPALHVTDHHLTMTCISP
jgi:hypothetical protein